MIIARQSINKIYFLSDFKFLFINLKQLNRNISIRTNIGINKIFYIKRNLKNETHGFCNFYGSITLDFNDQFVIYDKTIFIILKIFEKLILI